MTEGWVAWIGGAAMVLVTGYCLLRIMVAAALGLATDRPADVSHLLMGAGMVAMFVPTLTPEGDAAWVLGGIFALVAASFLVGPVVRRSARDAPSRRLAPALEHAATNGSMAFMVVAMAPGTSGGGDMAGMSMASGASHGQFVSAVALLVFAFLIFAAGRLALRLTPVGEDRLVLRSQDRGITRLMSPVWPACCELTMGLAMAAMVYTLV